MTAFGGSRTSVFRYLAMLGAAAMMLALLPLTGPVSAQQPDLADACPVEAPQAGFTDRDDVPDAHVRNVDCAAFLNIVRGFEGNLYRPRLAVRRDQMASFIAQALDAAGVQLPAGSEDQFTDVTTGPHRVNVNRLAEADIVRGGAQNLPPEQYGPGLQTRRDQMASFLMRAAGYALAGDPDAFEDDSNAPTDQVFDDVPSGNTHFGNVNAASENGLAQGFGGGVYRPRQATTRDQMASFVVRLLNFLARPHTVEITEQSAEQAPVGGEITVTATVFDQYGNPATESATVTFSTDTTTSPETQTVTTDANSQADFTFTSSVEGTVTVTAEIDGPGGNFIATGDSDSVQKQFGDAPTTTTTLVTGEGRGGGGGGGSATATAAGGFGSPGVGPVGGEGGEGEGNGGRGGDHGQAGEPGTHPGAGGGGRGEGGTSGAGQHGEVVISFDGAEHGTFAPHPLTEETATVTVPSGISEITVAAWGAGSNGGADLPTFARGGGGGGAFCGTTTAVQEGQIYEVIVGRAGPRGGESRVRQIGGPGPDRDIAVADGGGRASLTGGTGGGAVSCIAVHGDLPDNDDNAAFPGGGGGDAAPAAS